MRRWSQLGSDIFLGRLDHAVVASEFGIVLMHDTAGGFGLPDSFPESGQVGDCPWIQQSLHDSTMGVAADNDAGNFQYGHRVFDSGSAAALHGAIRRHHVAGVSKNKELAGIGLRKERVCRLAHRNR